MKKHVVKVCFIMCWLGLVIACSPPFKPDYNIAFGELIFKGNCQNQQVYLMDVARLQAYEDGGSRQDTILIDGITYNHVIRLDSTQSTFLATRKIHDKLSINLLSGPRLMLPTCSGIPVGSVETVNVISAEITDY